MVDLDLGARGSHSHYSPEAQVFTGTTFADLQPVRMSRVGVGGQYAGFEATPGTRYLLRVARSNSSPVEVMLIRGSVADRRTEAVELRLQNGLTQASSPCVAHGRSG